MLAIGGFTGSDPAPTLAEFEKLVAAHEIHYFVASGGAGRAGRVAAPGTGRRSLRGSSSTTPARTVGGMTVYDLTSAKG